MTRLLALLSMVVSFAGCAAAATPSADPSSPPVSTIHLTPRPPISADRTTGLVCGHIDQLDRLVVRRVDAFPENHVRFSFPAVVTVSDTDRVREVARAVCTLPKLPPDPMSCPMDWGLVYHLAFDAAPDVLVGATGCQGVRGIDPVAWTARSPDFWNMVAAVLGVPHHAMWGHRLN